jgi:hypothetical protein
MPNPDIAFKRGPCKECGGDGKPKYPNLVILTNATKDAYCPTCSGSGDGDYLLGDMVRKECKECHGKGEYLKGNNWGGALAEIPCRPCHGLSFTPSTELGDWEEACPWDFQVIKTGGLYEVTIFPKGYFETKDNERIYAEDADHLTALKMALGKALEEERGG